MRVLVTGANGFIAKNLLVHLSEKGIEVFRFTRGMSIDELAFSIAEIDFIFHLAGSNRPTNVCDFVEDNISFTEKLCSIIKKSGLVIPILYSSSIQACLDNPYGSSKRGAEKVLVDFSSDTGCPVYIYRLPNVFGKWSRPNYNSVVATFCHNIANDLPVHINDPKAVISLVYVDDLVDNFMTQLEKSPIGVQHINIEKIYSISLLDLANQILAFKNVRINLTVEEVGTGFARALYSTYLSFLKPVNFSYPLSIHEDFRGRFVEVLKTKNSGQFSYFTAHPGVTCPAGLTT